MGNAGTGKTRSVREAFDGIRCPVEMLAPSAEASRGVLRSADGGGFSKADTVASFLLSEGRQQAVKNGVIWVDEAGLLAIRDLAKLTDVARQQHAKIVLMGDNKQHASPSRSGNMFAVLQDYAGIVPGRLQEIWRQKHQGYKAVVADIAGGRRVQAFDRLDALGWVKRVDGNAPLVDDYMAGLKAGKSQIIVAPTHAHGDAITAEIRTRLKAAGQLGAEDHAVRQLVNLNWTAAERDDRERYDGSETLVFHRNSGTFKAGQMVKVADFQPGDAWKSADHFAVYREGTLPVAAGDAIRITANGKTADGHKLNNGAVYRVKGFDKHGGLVLDNDWTVPPAFGRLAHAYTSTSFSAQGKTVDRVLLALGSESRPAINAETFYVGVSRGREACRVFSDLPAEELKQAIGRTDPRKSATELMKPKPKKKRRLADRVRGLLKKARDRFKQLHADLGGGNRDQQQQRERDHGYER